MSDLISRQAAIYQLECWAKAFEDNGHEQSKADIRMIVKDFRNMPAAQPEREKGKWLGTAFDGYADGYPVYFEWQCSECGCIFEDEEPIYNFCPNCGAKMDGEE